MVEASTLSLALASILSLLGLGHLALSGSSVGGTHSALSAAQTIVWNTHEEAPIDSVAEGVLNAASDQCGAQGYPSGKTTLVKINPDDSGRTRTYHVYVPEGYKNTAPVGLHLVYSGLNAPCMNVFDGWKKTAEARGYILVAPCGSSGSLGVAWNSGTCCGFGASSKVDEFKFTAAIIKDITSKLCIDKGKVYASGFSNGAMMSEVLACKMGGVFKAVASVSGVVELRPGNKKGLSACDVAVKSSTSRTSVLNVHGTADPLVPWRGDAILGFPPIEIDMQRWAQRSGCTGEGKQTFAKGKFNNTIWATGCTGGAEFELVRNQGGVHEWPSNKDFDTTSYIQSFFDRVTK